MKNKKINTKGFTLIELLIAMTIFVAFTMVLMGSYTSIIKGNKEANDYRLLYSESRRIFEMMTDEVKNGMIYYPKNPAEAYPEVLIVLSKEMDKLKVFSQEGDKMVLCERKVYKDFYYIYNSAEIGFPYALNETAKITDFKFTVYPAADPYRVENAEYDSLQFQPLVHISVTFEIEISGKNKFELTLSTTISSRYYGESFPVVGAGECSLLVNYLLPTSSNE